MKILDNVQNIVRDDLVQTIAPHSKLSIAAACFSIYAYRELKAQLESVDELRFVFTSPTFTTDEDLPKREKREFFIPKLNRERSIYGTEFEVKLRNELTQKAIARECADWIRKKVKFRSNVTEGIMPSGFLNIESDKGNATYTPMSGFTTVDLGCDRGNNVYNIVNRFENAEATTYLQLFENIWNDKTRLADVTDEVIDSISSVYQENAPELVYFMALYNIFSEFLEDISEDVLPNEATGFKKSAVWNKLYNFQRDAALGVINKLEQYNGCILADSVGLGKTFTALAVIKYYEGRNKSVLVLCPKKLSENWNTYKANYKNNPLASDRLRYDVLFHTDLSRTHGMSNGIDLERVNWGNYDLVVIDESHNFRNGGEITYTDEDEEKENRYLRLMNLVIRDGVKTKVLMLSATPVNNRFNDLKNQLALAYEGDASQINDKLNTKSDIATIFRLAQKAYNCWSKLDKKERTTKALIGLMDFDFFKVLDSVTIARSRKHIETYYDITEIGAFPERNKPISLRPKLTDLPGAINYEEIYGQLDELNLLVYTPSAYIHPSRLHKYTLEDDRVEGLFRGREKGIKKLMQINLLKRLESSVHSFRLTVERIRDYILEKVRDIEAFEQDKKSRTVSDTSDFGFFGLDADDENREFFVGKKEKIDLADMDYLSWKRDLESDLENLNLLLNMIADITPKYDFKLKQLKSVIAGKINNPINEGNKKVIIFTAFADTAEYLYEHISRYVKGEFGLNCALITGAVEGRTTIEKFPADMNHILTCFSPVSKERDLLNSKQYADDIDILIATDCISEGQNLQDCDYCVNYDIHWNPVRIIQRFGRIDRLGSINSVIQLVNFWPDMKLDDYINLKARVEARMRISIMTSTGDDDYINADETGDLEYRREQLERLQNEVVDLEEMSSGISIMDLGLNDFRMDLLGYIKTHENLDRTPFGIHAVVRGEKPGVIFVLKNVNKAINIENQNQLHPFYMLYVGEDGEIICNHLQPKETLDNMRKLAHGRSEPNAHLCAAFNKATKNGKDMRRVSGLLQDAISSIISVKEERDIDSFFGAGQTTFLNENVSGLDDFELICFMVIKND